MGSTDEWFQANGTGVNNSFGATGSGDTAFTNSFSAPPPFNTGGYFVGAQYGVLGQAFLTNDADWPPADSYSANASVFGPSTEFTGVAGISARGAGVYGHRSLPGQDQSSIPNGLAAGVVGTSTDGRGVIGWSTNWRAVEGWAYQFTGVLGVSDFDYGVHGASTWQPGVLGASENDVGVKGLSGPEGADEGPPLPGAPNIAGVVGTSNTQHGVIGTSNALVGVYAYSKNLIGVVGQTSNPASYAGYFAGNLMVTGTKSAAVPFPDGTQRALYCMESPELWFEDFGTARLKRGRAVVKLDADFAKVIKRGDYRVFLTPEGDSRGLYVRRKSAASFEVRESQGGKSSIAFSYRVVGRRKDITGPRRFAKIETHLALPAAAARALRKPAPTAAGLRAFVARVEREARGRRPQVAKKGRRSRGLPKYLRRHIVAPPGEAGIK